MNETDECYVIPWDLEFLGVESRLKSRDSGLRRVRTQDLVFGTFRLLSVVTYVRSTCVQLQHVHEYFY